MIRRLLVSSSSLRAAGLAGLLLAACGPQAAPEDERETLDCTPAEKPPEARLLTRSEFRRTVEDLLGTGEDPTEGFPAEPEVEGFANNARSHQANPLLVEQYSLAASQLAQATRERGFDKLVPCASDSSERACAEVFARELGRRAYRRPLRDVEEMSLMTLYDRVAPGFGHDRALQAMVEVMLQSPQFLYRVEAPLTDQERNAAATDYVELGSYELASRLSYFLWGSMPDDELLRVAEAGALDSEDELENQALRLLDDPRARDRIRQFHRAWLDLDRLQNVVRNDASAEAGPAWEESLLAFLDSVFWAEDGSIADLFLSRQVHLGPELAPLYGIDRSEASSHVVEWEERRGLLTQPGLLALLSHSDQSSPIQRGVFVRDQILCAPVPAPPPDVNNNPPDPDPDLTTRQRFAVHTEDPGCAACHRLIDPLGFGFENFDHVGRFRTKENGVTIDTSGELVGSPDPDIEGPFDDIQALSERLVASPSVSECIAEKWFTFALGAVMGHEADCSLDHVTEAMAASDGNLKQLLVAIATSNTFRYRATHSGGSDE